MSCSMKRSSRGHFAVGSNEPSTRNSRNPLPRAHFASAVYRPLRATMSGASRVMLLAAVVLEQARGNGVGGLRFDARVAGRAVLHAEFHVQQAQEMIDLGQRGDRALVAAAAGALLDGHRGWYAEDGVHIRARRGLHELPCVGIQGFEVAPLALGEQDVESQGALAAAGNAGDDRELIAARVRRRCF